MNEIDPLGLDSLPSDPKENVLRLLGLTTSSLKDIDERVVGNSPFVRGLKIDPYQVVKEVVSTPLQPQQVLPQPVPTISPQVGLTEQIPQHNYVQVASPPQPIVEENKDQLEFDFYKKIKPEDLELQIRNLNLAVSRLENKIDILTDHIIKKKASRLTNANRDQ